MIPISRQCELLGKSRSWYYYRPRENTRRKISDDFYKYVVTRLSSLIPFYGYRKIALEAFERYRIDMSFKQTYRLRTHLGLHAVRMPPPTSTPRTAHAVYPYLLANREITKPNQVWEVDITYLNLPQGIVYLCAIIDVYSRKVLGWNLSNTMDVFFVLWPLTWAIERYGRPEIINTDQGSQFTTHDWIAMVEDLDIRISMNGKGRSLDNIFIERWWRSFKHEDFYINQYQTVKSLKRSITEYIDFYNTRRFHQALGYKRPDEVFYASAWNLEKAA